MNAVEETEDGVKIWLVKCEKSGVVIVCSERNGVEVWETKFYPGGSKLTNVTCSENIGKGRVSNFNKHY